MDQRFRSRTFGLSAKRNGFDRRLRHVPILNLARIGRLELLPLLYRQVLIPSAVFEELTASKRDLRPAIDFASEPWLIVASVKIVNRPTARACTTLRP